ncbi:hypothetical protein MANY_25630 [Mycolicibacterium anyangense]|uniref:PE family protein n=1 Tax=Mycolicibacterium anyangense TaxID=1431246 RepID=A0A6N4W5J1_9MYCO|nr:hypothetical protein [Mycolicibacterium anyangense]BBZ77226.1 hypothetical protein MANY_25630 [Mycolicibacterium anyangense]
MTVSVRSYLTAGMAAMAASALVVAPVHVPTATSITAAAVRLSAAVQPLVQPTAAAAAVLGVLDAPVQPKPAAATTTIAGSSTPQAAATASATSAGSVIINAYNAIEPWVAYGFALGQYALGFIPGLWWLAPGISLAYYTVEPVVQSLVYSFAYLIDGNWGAIGPELAAGLNQAAVNFVNYGLAWIGSLVPLPPLPPFPPLPGAALTSPAAAAAAGGKPADTKTETTAPATAATGHSARVIAVKDTPSVAASSAQVAASSSTTSTPDSTTPDSTSTTTSTTASDTTPDTTSDATPDTPKTGGNSSNNGGSAASGGTAKNSGATGGSGRAMHKAKASKSSDN